MKKKLFKNKVQMVVYVILFIICIGLFIYIGNIDFSKNKETDAEIFSELYNKVPIDNKYVLADGNDVLHLLNGQSGIVLFGFPSNEWTNYNALFLYDVAKEFNIDKIYYYDFLDDRNSNNGTYETIVTKLSAYVPTFDSGKKNIQAPTILVVKKGKIIAFLDDVSIIKGDKTPEEYYTDYEEGLAKDLIKRALTEYLY